MCVLGDLKASNNLLYMLQRLVVALWQFSSTALAARVSAWRTRRGWGSGRGSGECGVSAGGDTGSLNEGQQGMICPPVYAGKNLSGPETSRPSWLCIDSDFCGSEGPGEGRSCTGTSEPSQVICGDSLLWPVKPSESLMGQLLKSQDAQKGDVGGKALCCGTARAEGAPSFCRAAGGGPDSRQL